MDPADNVVFDVIRASDPTKVAVPAVVKFVAEKLVKKKTPLGMINILLK